MNVISPKIHQNSEICFSTSTASFQTSPCKLPPANCIPAVAIPSPGGDSRLCLVLGSSWGHGEGFYQGGGRGKDKWDPRHTGKGRCGRRAAPGLCTEGVANMPGRGPGRSWGPLKVGKSEKYFPKLVFGQLQPALSNDTKRAGIWTLRLSNPNRCLLTPHLLSPSQDALSAFSSLHLLKPGCELPLFPHANSALGLPVSKLAILHPNGPSRVRTPVKRIGLCFWFTGCGLYVKSVRHLTYPCLKSFPL